MVHMHSLVNVLAMSPLKLCDNIYILISIKQAAQTCLNCELIMKACSPKRSTNAVGAVRMISVIQASMQRM